MNKFWDLIKETYQRKGIQRILMNWHVFEHCQNLEGVMVDLGAGRNPSYYKYWRINPSKFIRVDVSKEEKPDILADLNQPLPIDNDFADVVFLLNVIYIIKEPEALMKEIHRILKKNGKLFIYSPFVFNESREPDDYFRFTSQGLEDLIKGAGFSQYQLIATGERFSAALNLSEKIFIFNALKVPLRLTAMLLDRIYPKKLKRLHPCPMGYFVKAIK